MICCSRVLAMLAVALAAGLPNNDRIKFIVGRGDKTKKKKNQIKSNPNLPLSLYASISLPPATNCTKKPPVI